MYLLTVSARGNGRNWPKCPKSAVFFKKSAFPGCFFITDGRRDLGIGSYERSWAVDRPFDSFGQGRPPEMAEICQNVQNPRFFETWAFPGCFFVTDGYRDLGIGSYERSWPVDMLFDSFGQGRPPEMAEIGQNVPKQRFFSKHWKHRVSQILPWKPYLYTFHNNNNKEVFVKHEKAPTAPRFEGVLTIQGVA